MNRSMIITCPNCKTRVLPKSDGTCPSCQSIIPQKEKGSISKFIEPIKNNEASTHLKQEPSSITKIKSTTKAIDKRRVSSGSSLGSKNVAAERTQSAKPKQKPSSQSTPPVSPDQQLTQQQAASDPKNTLVRGLFRVDLGHHLGQQEIYITILKGEADGDYEQVIVKSISESGARHILIAGVSASAVFSDVHSDFISLPNGKYSFSFRDVPSASQDQVLRDFAELRRSKPNQNHILVCPTHPETVSGCGIFDQLPQASDGAAVYVIGYGLRYNNLIANFYRCVNVRGKAKGFVHSIVSLDSPRITNEDFDRLHAIASPIEKLQFFWNMENQRFGSTPMPKLLGITAA